MSKGYALILSLFCSYMCTSFLSFAAADVPHDCAISAAMLAVVLLLKESMDADVDEKIRHFYQQWLTEGIECAVCYLVDISTTVFSYSNAIQYHTTSCSQLPSVVTGCCKSLVAFCRKCYTGKFVTY